MKTINYGQCNLEQMGNSARHSSRGEWGGLCMNRRKGFTLIELLVVIAIIGILAAITFPVFAQVKKSAFKSSDISNMNSIRTALQLYKADQGSYPPVLLGYVGPYSDNILNGNIVPPGSVRGALYPKRIDAIATLRPSLNRVLEAGTANDAFNTSKIESGADPMVTTAVWPSGSVYSGGNDQASMSLQRFGPTTTVSRCVDATAGTAAVNYYYRVSGYDVANVKSSATATRNELHYAPFFTAYSVPAAPCDLTTGTGNVLDDRRQLGYDDPPETTVVTWNSFFRDYDGNGNVSHGKQEIVLFLGGAARPFDSVSIVNSAWKVTP